MTKEINYDNHKIYQRFNAYIDAIHANIMGTCKIKLDILLLANKSTPDLEK